MKYLPYLAACALQCVAAAASAADMALIGSHPTSPLTAYPAIHNLKSFNGRIYMAYGNYDFYPVNVIASFDPAQGKFRLEHSACTDSIDHLRVLNGRLYAPSVDPIHYDDFRELSFLTPGLGWRDRSPLGNLHVFDAAQLSGNLYLSGGRDTAEGAVGGACLARSTDDGLSWTTIRSGTISRYYWCFPLGNRIYVQNGWWEEGVGFSTSSLFTSYTYLHDATQIPAATPFVVALSGRAPSNSGGSYSLISFDGTLVRTLRSGVIDFIWDGTTLFTLESGGIFRSTALSALSITMANAGLTSLPSSPRALEVASGVAYVATGTGTLWGGRLDGLPYLPGTVTTVNELPDSFGRSLAFDGAQLSVGAPDFSTATVPLTGRGTLWSAPVPWSGAAFAQTATFDPPIPDLSGWFAKDMALDGDLLAMVEAGYDTTNSDRGSSARVHLLQRVGAAWVSRSILSVPYAHSVAIADGMILVGTGNPAASQTAGQPGVNPYLIVRDGSNNVAFLVNQTQLNPVLVSWGYKSVVDVATDAGLLAAGFAGDPSRNGGIGMCSVYRRTAAGTTFEAAPVFEASTGLPDHFGYSVALHSGWLAVGAPRDDTAAAQAGAVYLYEKSATAPGFVFRQKINSPVAQAEAAFGAAVALRYDTLLIGSPGVDAAGTPRTGAVHRYRRVAGSWVAEAQLPRPPMSDSEFGIEVALGEQWMAGGSRFSRPGTLVQRVALSPVPTGFRIWAESHALTGPASAPEADGDLDGVANITEYHSGLDPHAPDTRPYDPAGPASGLPSAIAEPAAPDHALLFRYLRPVDDSRLVCTVEASEDLAAWASATIEPVGVIARGTLEEVTVRVHPPTAATARFFVRLKAAYP